MVVKSKIGKTYAIAKYNRRHIVIGGSNENINLILPGTKINLNWAEGNHYSSSKKLGS